MAQKINVDVTPGLFQQTLYYHQGDVGREFEIEIATKDGYTIPSGATFTIQATKPSGLGFSVTGTATGNVVAFTSTEEMTDEFGRFPAQLKIADGTDTIFTANFLMVGEIDVHPDGTTDGSQETIIPTLTLLVERVENAAAAVLDTTTEVTTLPAGSQATYSFDEETNTATFGIPQGEAGAGAAGVVASAYSASKTYAVGDYVIHNSNLYRCTTAITTAESFTAAHWTQVVLADDVTDLKSELYDIREPKENLGYVTQFNGTKSAGGVTCEYIDKSHLKIYGTATSWVRMNLLRGNSQIVAGTPTFTNNLPAGTYTLKADTDKAYIFYGADWDSRTQWVNGETKILTNSTMVWIAVKTSTQNFGTSDNPTIYNFELYEGDVSTVPTAIDVIARADIADIQPIEKIVYADFDTVKPYNILPKDTVFTPNTRIRRTTGEVEASTGGYLASDYIPIDAAKEYLTVGEYVYLVGETGTGLVTGGNRVWAQSYVAFYDENKQYVATTSSGTDLAKAIPTNAKYVRMTAISASVIPYAILVYGNNTEQLWLRYTEYRKEITEECVYASTGMEKLNMVMFGDSIVQGSPGLSHDGLSLVDYANDYLRSNIINVGFGGTRMSQGSPDAVGLASFASLCETIVSNEADKWDALDAYATASEPYWDAHIATLKAVDWTKVQAVGLLYGANDWHNNVPIGTEYNENPLNYDGACAYGLKLLLTKYPHLQVILFTPFYRIADNVHSDTPNGAGVNMDAYGASLKHVQTMFHCPIVDSGNELGINRYTIYSYSATNDGTHPRKVLGLERIGRFFAESVKRYIQPY